ncbi:MAG TPA: FAD-dependent oxidoreductase [Actinoplanes sp.]|nr:FAD-dependent oxidoreductase [Actinoplanes sp.]
MPHVVTQSCCSDASCVVACPVNCIHPAPGESGFAEAEMVYIDPKSCVDCGACVTACPVEAIKPHTRLTPAEKPFIALNAAYFEGQPHLDRSVLAPLRRRRALDGADVRVAVVGSGPAGMYAADELLRHPGVEVDVLERLDRPYGLARYGVAPDHVRTRKVSTLFDAIAGQPGFRMVTGVEVGTDLTTEVLAHEYHAVLYAVGASADGALGVEGEHLSGSVPATSVVGWYNGHPDHRDAYIDLGGERVVVVGNGNVALDVARILTADPTQLDWTEIADEALSTLRGSRVREVVVLGRRGPAQAAFTLPELIGLAGLPDVDVLVDDDGAPIVPDTPKTALLAELAARTPRPGRRRIVLRFHAAPVRVRGTDHVTGLEVARTELRPHADGVLRAEVTDDVETLDAVMVLRSVGYRATPVPGLPFDPDTNTVPNERGRVAPGVYVAGWIKRGPTGFLGTNKSCAEETVAALLDDLESGLLSCEADEIAVP